MRKSADCEERGHKLDALQWDRTSEGAEIIPPIIVFVNVFMLQWDRTSEGAEMDCWTRTAKPSTLLQWDRTSEGAEIMFKVEGYNKMLICFNGTAPRKVRK